MNVVLLMNAVGGGGAEKQALLNAALLANHGHRCEVFCLARLPAHERMETIINEVGVAGVRVHRPERETSFSPRIVWRLIRLLGRGEVDFLWTWGYRAEAVRMMLFFATTRVRAVVALRSAHEREIYQMRWFWRISMWSNPVYISNSQRNCDLLARQFSRLGQRALVIHNIMEPAALTQEPVRLPERIDRLELVMLGNIRVSIKGYDVAVQLAHRLKDAGMRFRLRVGGFPHEGPALQAMIDAAGVQDVMEISGVVFHPFDFLRTGHVFLLLSRVEGMPNSLLEAMALGMPCISTPVGDVGIFARDREHLRIVEIEAVEQVSAILHEWQANWREAHRLGAAARQLCHESFTPEVIGRQLQNVFVSLAPVQACAQ